VGKERAAPLGFEVIDRPAIDLLPRHAWKRDQAAVVVVPGAVRLQRRYPDQYAHRIVVAAPPAEIDHRHHVKALALPIGIVTFGPGGRDHPDLLEPQRAQRLQLHRADLAEKRRFVCELLPRRQEGAQVVGDGHLACAPHAHA
jgi:hypothetical protein